MRGRGSNRAQQEAVLQQDATSTPVPREAEAPPARWSGRGALAIVVLLVLVLAVAATATVRRADRAVTDAANDAAQSAATAAATSVDSLLQRRAAVLRATASALFRDGTSDELLASALQPLGIPFALVLDPAVPEMLATHPTRELDAADLLSQFAHLREAAAGETGFGPVATDDGRAGVAVAVPILVAGQPAVLSTVVFVDDDADLRVSLDVLARATRAAITLTGVDAQEPSIVALPEGRTGAEASEDDIVAVALATAGLSVAATGNPVDLYPPAEGSVPSWLLLLLVWVTAGGLVAATVAISRAEERSSRARIALERSQDVQRSFVAVAAHELRTPVAVVGGMTNLLAERWNELEPAERELLAQRAAAGAERLGATVESVLTASMVSDGLLDVQATDAAVRPLLLRAIDGSEAAGRDVHLDVEDGLRAHVDPLHLERLVTKLLDNAGLHGQPPIEVVGRVDGATVRIEVADHGAPIAEEHRERIFERFWQVEDHERRKNQGIGLGLFVARALAEAMGGSLVHVRRGERTVFELTVPGTGPGSNRPQP